MKKCLLVIIFLCMALLSHAEFLAVGIIEDLCVIKHYFGDLNTRKFSLLLKSANVILVASQNKPVLIDSVLHSSKAALIINISSKFHDRIARSCKNYLQVYNESRHCRLAAYYYKPIEFKIKEHDRYHACQTSKYNANTKYLMVTNQLALADMYFSIHDSACSINTPVDLLAENYLNWYKFDFLKCDSKDAMAYLQLSKDISASLSSTEKAGQMADLQVSYHTKKKDEDVTSTGLKIQLLNKQPHYQQVRILYEKTVKQFTFVRFALLVVVFGLIYTSYRQKQRINKKLQLQQEEINAANASLTKMSKSLQKLLAEKEWLLKEIHHRVKNNLQIVISLLNTQSAYLDNADALEAIRNSQNRMHAMSLIHQKLYQSDNLASIDMSLYVRELIEYLSDSLSAQKQISMSIDVSPIMLDVSQAVPLGLIINEAVSNSIKYAFPSSNKGVISVFLHQITPEECKLIVSDNGPGLPQGFDVFENNSLGMSLMYGLSQQLEGKFELDNRAGLSVSVRFRLKPF